MNLPKRVEKLEQRATELVRVRAVPIPPPVPLDVPTDVLALIAEQVNGVRADAEADSLERARTLGMLAGLAIRTMEARDLDARLEAVERVLKLRQQDEREANGADDQRESGVRGRSAARARIAADQLLPPQTPMRPAGRRRRRSRAGGRR